MVKACNLPDGLVLGRLLVPRHTPALPPRRRHTSGHQRVRASGRVAPELWRPSKFGTGQQGTTGYAASSRATSECQARGARPTTLPPAAGAALAASPGAMPPPARRPGAPSTWRSTPTQARRTRRRCRPPPRGRACAVLVNKPLARPSLKAPCKELDYAHSSLSRMFLSVVDGQTRSALSGIRVGLGPSVRGPSSCQSKGPRLPHVRTEHPARPMEAVTSAHRDHNRSKTVRLPLSYGGTMLWHEAQRAIQSSLRMSLRLASQKRKSPWPSADACKTKVSFEDPARCSAQRLVRQLCRR